MNSGLRDSAHRNAYSTARSRTYGSSISITTTSYGYYIPENVWGCFFEKKHPLKNFKKKGWEFYKS
jgi:hypothetical protein